MGQRRSASAGFIRLAAGLAAALVAILAAGCGGGGSSPKHATLLLDFTPNANHAGIYSALRRYDRSEGVHLTVRVPSDSAQSVQLLVAGRADLAILDIHDLALARERGRDLVGVTAIVQRPLAAVIAAPGIGSPRALEGRRVGVTGVPSDDAVLRSEVKGAGGNPSRVRTVTIGFNAVQSLLAGRVSGATAFWNIEGVALQRRGRRIRAFKVDEYGAPAYPELVVCVTRRTLDRRRDLIRRVLRTLTKGYEAAYRDPRRSALDLVRAQPSLDPQLTISQVIATAPAFIRPGRAFGKLDPATLRSWAAWEVRFGIVRRAPDVGRAFQTSS